MGILDESWSQYRHLAARKPQLQLPSSRSTVSQSSSSSQRCSATRCGSQSSSSVPTVTAMSTSASVKGGGYTSQIYAVRQAIAKALVAWYQKYVDEASKKEIKE